MSQGSQLQAHASRSRGLPLRSLANAFRLADWWNFKLTPPLAVFCGSLLVSGEPLLPHWAEMGMLVAAIATCAAYVSLINDHFDREEDTRSGKANRLAELPLPLARLLMLAVGAVGAIIAFSWRTHLPAILCYAASWLVFTVYSAPPLRLKTRGFAGLLADAAGSTLFPVMLAVILAARTTSIGHDPAWIAASAMWAAGWGLRGILWHQVKDAEHDRAGSVRTFVQRHGVNAAFRLRRYFALPLELIGLAVLTGKAGSLIPLLFLTLYLGVAAGRSILWRVPISGLILDEYYDGLLAPAMIAASAIRHPSDWLLLLPYFLLFGRRPAYVLYHALRLCRDAARRASGPAAHFLPGMARGRFRSD